MAAFNKAIELDPDYAWAIAHRGITYRQMGDYGKALADFDRAIELNPDSDWYLYNRALTYRTSDQPDEAQSDLAAAIHQAQETYGQDGTNWRNIFRLALYHLAAGESEDAERLYQEALSGGASWPHIYDAIRNLDDFLTLFSDQPQAQAMRNLLQEHLEETTP